MKTHTVLLMLAGVLGALALSLVSDPDSFKLAARRAKALEVQNED